jgi:small subunit ribosomal protein S6
VPFVTRRYEVVYIFDPALDEAAVTERLGRFHALLGEGVQPTVNHWGKRTLAFPIKRHDTGYYVVTQFEAEPTVLPEFERAIKLEEGVVRFLVVLMETEMAAVPVEAVAASEEDGDA